MRLKNQPMFRGLESWTASRIKLFKTIQDNRPFYPAEIYEELKQLEHLLNLLNFTRGMLHENQAVQGLEQRRGQMEQISEQFRKVEASIRDRLRKFD